MAELLCPDPVHLAHNLLSEFQIEFQRRICSTASAQPEGNNTASGFITTLMYACIARLASDAKLVEILSQCCREAENIYIKNLIGIHK